MLFRSIKKRNGGKVRIAEKRIGIPRCECSVKGARKRKRKKKKKKRGQSKEVTCMVQGCLPLSHSALLSRVEPSQVEINWIGVQRPSNYHGATACNKLPAYFSLVLPTWMERRLTRKTAFLNLNHNLIHAFFVRSECA